MSGKGAARLLRGRAVSNVERAAEVLRQRMLQHFDGVSVNVALAEALAAAGLLPTDQGETRTEWGVRISDGIALPAGSEAGARLIARYPGRVLLRREVTTGPWVEVPS